MKNSQLSPKPKSNSFRPPPAPPSFSIEELGRWRQPTAARYALEIGCGVGFHPISWAKQNRTGQILAIERTFNKFQKFRRRLDHHVDLASNIFAAHADATWLLPQLPTEDLFDDCFWLYPNPEPKRPNHRIAHSSFTRFVVERLKTGGRLTIATNIEAYAAEMRHQLPITTPLKLEIDETLKSDHEPRTHFEKKYLARGETCFNLVFSKPDPDNNHQ